MDEDRHVSVSMGLWTCGTAPAKLWEIWAGDGGVLANINSLATGAAVVMAFAWVLWRVVGPAIGLYDLQSGIDSAPNIGIQ